MRDLKGYKFGQLTVLREGTRDKGNGERTWLCKCDCGKFKNVRGSHLKSGATKSCGCLIKMKSGAKPKHGLCKSRTYRIWHCMKQRCYDPKHKSYPDYGGRGITVCAEWLNDPLAFHSWAITHGYSDDLSIDRINVDGNYEPSNCRWATTKEQRANRRR